MQKIQARQALLPTGWAHDVSVILNKGCIAQIVETSPGAAMQVDLLLPAPVNLHSHAFQRAMAGLTETRGPDPHDSFWTWRSLMYRFLDRLTPEQVEAIAAQVFMEMLESGFGAVAEFHYLHHDVGGVPYSNLAEMAGRIVAAAQTAGLGLTLLPVLYMAGGCDGRPLQGGQQRFGNDLDRFGDLHEASTQVLKHGFDDHRIGRAAHSLRAVPPEALTGLLDMAREGPLHMHLAEQVAEVAEVTAHLGARPIEWILDNMPIDERWCLIHCTQMTQNETTRLAATGAVAGLCPITESSLGDGIFNGTEYQTGGGLYGVGSDSNIHIALWEELATFEYSQRLRDRSRAALATPHRSTGRMLFDAVTRAGAQAAGRASGQIGVGQVADLIAISTDNAFLCNRSGDAVLDSLIFTGRGRDCVTDVWSAGRHMVQDGRHVHRDEIETAFKAVTEQLGQSI
ncbi:MAG: formimidoylglutamate deiminase [Pseudomonadota bacterium]